MGSDEEETGSVMLSRRERLDRRGGAPVGEPERTPARRDTLKDGERERSREDILRAGMEVF